MAEDNVFDENVEYLIAARDTVIQLEELDDKLEELKASRKKSRRLISQEEKSIDEEINSTIRKRKIQIEESYDRQIEANNARIRQIQSKKDKKKNQQMSVRIENETAHIKEGNRQLKLDIKTLFKQNHVPRFCNSGLYYSLFSPKGFKEIIELMFAIIIMCGLLPSLISYVLYRTILSEKMVTCVIIAALIIIVELIIYFIVFNLTKVKHRDDILEGRKTRDQIKANEKAMKAIRNSIAKDKDESVYNLTRYDKKINQLEEEGNKISDSKKEALKDFEKTTRKVLTDEIENRRKEKLNELQEELKRTEEEISSVDSSISELELTITNKYSTYLGKEFCTEEKLSDLISIMEEGAADTVADAIRVYKGIDK